MSKEEKLQMVEVLSDAIQKIKDGAHGLGDDFDFDGAREDLDGELDEVDE